MLNNFLNHKGVPRLCRRGANEVAILTYCVANLNAGAAYSGVAGQWAEFPFCWTGLIISGASFAAVREGSESAPRG